MIADIISVEMVSSVALLCGALAGIFAAWEFLKKRKDERRTSWQRAIVQSILQKETDLISFDQIKVKYRSEAAGEINKTIDGRDISDESLRNILIDLCRDNALVQMGGDVYSLNTVLGVTQKMLANTIEMTELQKIFFKAQLELLSEQHISVRRMVEMNEKLVDLKGK